VEGDAGAPLEAEELPLLEKHFAVFKKYMTVEGLLAVAAGGLWSTQDEQMGEEPAEQIGLEKQAGEKQAEQNKPAEQDKQTEQGKHYVTPIINGRDCAYLYRDADGISKCAIEKAYAEKEIDDFQKPISCHLFPIRIDKYDTYDAVNYFHWHICHDAVRLGNAEEIPVFRFLKEPLIRKYGENWYEQAEEIFSLIKPAK
jgi:hypothetical protein